MDLYSTLDDSSAFMYYTRHIEKKIIDAKEMFKDLFMTGPRQVWNAFYLGVELEEIYATIQKQAKKWRHAMARYFRGL